MPIFASDLDQLVFVELSEFVSPSPFPEGDSISICIYWFCYLLILLV